MECPPFEGFDNEWNRHLVQMARFIELGSRSRAEEEQIWRTVTCHHRGHYPADMEGRRLPLIQEDGLSLWLRMMRGKKIKSKSLTKAELDVLERLRSESPNPIALTSRQIASFAFHARQKDRFRHVNRRLFKTRKGMLGLGRSGLQKGDIVTILWGGRTPIILRRRDSVGEGYYSRGDAYIDGLMYGKFLDTNPSEKTFRIY